jgi:hypothetical protein
MPTTTSGEKPPRTVQGHRSQCWREDDTAPTHSSRRNGTVTTDGHTAPDRTERLLDRSLGVYLPPSPQREGSVSCEQQNITQVKVAENPVPKRGSQAYNTL